MAEESEAKDAISEPEDLPAPVEIHSKKAKPPLRPWRILGWTSFGAGLAAVGVGVGLWTAKPVEMVDPEDFATIIVRSTTHSGAALMGIGSGVAALGVTIVVVEHVLHKRESSARALRITPQADPTQMGFLVTGRF